MDGFFKDFRFPGRGIVLFVLGIIAVASLAVSVITPGGVSLGRVLKILALCFDAAGLYVLFWIVRKGVWRQYSRIVLLIIVLVAGVTMMAYL